MNNIMGEDVIAEMRAEGDTRKFIGFSNAMEARAYFLQAGADTFVSGTALFGQRQLGRAVRKMREAVGAAAASVMELSR